MEWFLAIIQRAIGRTSYSKNETRKWFRVQRLEILDDGRMVEWADFMKGRMWDSTYVLREELLALRLAVAGLFFLPFSVISFLISKGLIKRKVTSDRATLALNLSRVGLITGIVLVLVLATTKNKIVP